MRRKRLHAFPATFFFLLGDYASVDFNGLYNSTTIPPSPRILIGSHMPCHAVERNHQRAPTTTEVLKITFVTTDSRYGKRTRILAAFRSCHYTSVSHETPHYIISWITQSKSETITAILTHRILKKMTRGIMHLSTTPRECQTYV